MEIMESAEQNIITVQPEETAFFEEFTKKYAISWTREEKLNNILPLSKSYVGNKTKLNWFLKSFASQIYLPDSLVFGIK